MNNILKAWNAGFVRRWHTQPELCDHIDYDSAHQQRCTILLLLFWPNSSRSSIIDTVIHDQGECDAGDMAGPAKQKHPEIRDLLNSVEFQSIMEQGFTYSSVTEEEFNRRKFVDLLDSYVWMLRNKCKMARKPEWKSQLDSLYGQAENLNISVRFDTFIQAAIGFYEPN
jgi:hypothetical protein